MAKSQAEKAAEKAAKEAKKAEEKAAKEAEKAAEEEAEFQASLEGLSDEEKAEKIAEREGTKPSPKGKFPEVSKTGAFQAVPFKEGFVVYNPDGARVSGVVSDSEARDLVSRMNADAHIKAKK